MGRPPLTMVFATQDQSDSRLFLGTFLVWSWLGLTFVNTYLPRVLARLVFQKGHRLPTVFIGSVASFARLNEGIVYREDRHTHPLGPITEEGRHF